MILIDTGGAVIKSKARLIDYEGPPLIRGAAVLIVNYENGVYGCISWKNVLD